MEAHNQVLQRIEKIINSQKIAVLGTSRKNEPYSCLVAFVSTKNLKELIFATMRRRLKYQNMMANPRVALMVDDRDKRESDFEATTSITVIGTAEDTVSETREKYAALLIKRHPELTDFVNSPDCAVIRVKVDKIYIVSEFESVLKIER
jgi:nitroimidazol reductase NimA-like FMN-containing flavoprotein (pyridoxamine 5'-phosphate oxidase superfamily)